MGRTEQDDIIGTCHVPLSYLVTDCSIRDKYILKSPTDEPVGELEVELKIMRLEDTETDHNRFFNAIDQSMYSKNWEAEVIMRIARKLANVPCDIEMMFGIFTYGRRNCTKADFKHTVLHKLNLAKEGMTEKELDIIFQSNEYLSISEIIEVDDFMSVFAKAIS